MRRSNHLLTRNLLLTIGIGFVLSILLMVGVGLFALHELTAADVLVNRVVRENVAKERIVSQMRDLLKAKAISLLTVVALDDPFDKNVELEHLYQFGDRYQTTRLELDRLPLNGEERAVLAHLDRLTLGYCPLERQISELGLQGYTFMAFDVLQKEAFARQRGITEQLAQLQGIQQAAIQSADQEAEQRYARTRWLVLALGGFSLLSAVVVALLVLQRTFRMSSEVDRERTRFFTLFKSNADGILLLDGRRPVQCNPAMLSLFGVEREAELLTIDPERLGSPPAGTDPASGMAKHIERAYAEGHDTFEWRCRRRNGSEFPALIQMYVMQLDGRPHIQCIVRDIGSLKAAETKMQEARDAALATARLKSQFVANVSHEIRTPMNGIIGMTRLLLHSDLTPRQREYAESVDNASQSLMHIINDLLDFSKIEAGHMTAEDTPFDLMQVIGEAISINRPRIENKGLALRRVIQQDLPRWVSGDPLRLRQILLNLLDNALKFTGKGEVALEVDYEPDIRRYRFRISDTGIGISPAALPRIFDAFSQADGSIGRHFGGTGLGLAICRQLSHLLGGTLTAASELGHGSIFVLTLPLRQISQPEPIQARNAAPEQVSIGTGRILVAEDNPVNQKLIRFMLENLGLPVAIVDDGRQAFQAVRTQHWDMVLMDCQMPEWDGLMASRAIREWERDNGRQRLPIVALTANAMAGFDRVCREAGMDGYLIKPLSEHQLLACLGKWLSCQEQPDVARTEPAAPADIPTKQFDFGRVSHTCRGNPDHIREMLELFVSSTRDLIAFLDQAAACRDSVACARQAHQIKGASAYLGADTMARLAAGIEQASKGEDWNRFDALRQDMETQFARVRTEIDTSLANPAG